MKTASLLCLFAFPCIALAKAYPWIPLFDGTSAEAFRGYNLDTLPENWTVRDGVLSASGGNIDIVTRDQFTDFELELEYRLTPGGNSGVFFYVKEHDIWDKIWRTGVEYQIIDNRGSEFAQRSPKNRAASVFALYAAEHDNTRPTGEWNTVRITARDGEIEYWMNGKRVLTFEMWTEHWYTDREETLHNSNRKPFWGEFRRGHIALQDEGFPVDYRNIRVRRLR